MKLVLSVACYAAFMVALVVTPGSAQERSAAGSLNVQTTWTELNGEVRRATTKSDMVDIRINQIVKCSRKAMLYAPGGGADKDGCIENSKIAALSSRVSEINTEIVKINDQVAALNTHMEKADARLNDVDTKVSTQASQIRDLYVRDNQKAAQIGDLYGRTNDLYNQINAIRAILSAMDGTLVNHGNRLDGRDGAVGDLYNRGNLKVGQIADLYGIVHFIKQCGALGQLADGATGRCRDVLVDANRRIDEINAKISALNGQIGDLYNKFVVARNDIDYIKHCGSLGMLLDGSTNSCRSPLAPLGRWTLVSTIAGGSEGYHAGSAAANNGYPTGCSSITAQCRVGAKCHVVNFSWTTIRRYDSDWRVQITTASLYQCR